MSEDRLMVDVANRAVPRLVMLGRQGSGKGEQSGRLAARLDIEHISTGALLRAAIRDATSLGSAAAEAVERGEPVSDGLVVGLVAERLAVATALGRGVVLDGFPRTAAQAERLAALAPATPIDLAIHLVVPRALAVSRIQSRRVCDSCGWSGRTARCGHCNRPTTRRADDWPAAIGRRMSEHDRQIGPLLDWFGARNALAVVDGVGAPDDVEDRVAEVVGRALEGAHQRSTATAV